MKNAFTIHVRRDGGYYTGVDVCLGEEIDVQFIGKRFVKRSGVFHCGHETIATGYLIRIIQAQGCVGELVWLITYSERMVHYLNAALKYFQDCVCTLKTQKMSWVRPNEKTIRWHDIVIAE